MSMALVSLTAPWRTTDTLLLAACEVLSTAFISCGPQLSRRDLAPRTTNQVWALNFVCST